MIPPTDLLNFLRNEDNFLILTHMNPDADGLGSSLALSMALAGLGKRAVLLDQEPLPHLYRFLPGSERFHSFAGLEGLGLTLDDFSNFILVDCNHIDRVVDHRQGSSVKTLKGTVAVIDHHEETGRPFGDIRWVVPEAAATGLMIYHLIRELGMEITEEMATNLYAAIALDTGNFRYENTGAEVLRVAADLVEAGAKPHVIFREIYELWSWDRFDLFLKVLDTLQFEDSTAITTVTRKMLAETSTVPDDTETFVAFPRILKDVEISILLREIDHNHYKVSLRSKGDINVAQIAGAFGGGGHKNAAGCTIRADLETAKAQLLEKVKSSRHALVGR